MVGTTSSDTTMFKFSCKIDKRKFELGSYQAIMALPSQFAVVDMAADFPIKYYIFITAEINGNQEVHNMIPSSSYTEDGYNDEYVPRIESSICYYPNLNSNTYVLRYWNTGMTLTSSTDVIPVYEFVSELFTKHVNLQSPLCPVYAHSTNIVLQSKRKRLIRKMRALLLYSGVSAPVEPVVADVVSAPPSVPVATEFILPRHVCEALVQKEIQDKKGCSISLLSFEEVSVVGITECYHCFSAEELTVWLSTHGTCPLCRSVCRNVCKYRRIV